MSSFTRILDLSDLLVRKSFLFGPRATGKSYLVKTQLADSALVIDLLRSDVFYRLAAHSPSSRASSATAGISPPSS